MRTVSSDAEVIARAGLDENGLDTCGLRGIQGEELAINELGDIAYEGRLLDAVGSEVSTVFLDSSKVWDARNGGFDPTNAVFVIAVNDSAEVAFQLIDTNGNANLRGVYTGPDSVADKVLEIGDPLCGSTVSDIVFGRYGLDPLGRLALLVGLDDARKLVIRAEPTLSVGGACETAPEPIDGAVAALAAMIGLGASARGRRSRDTDN